jgi:hypothetical protein
MNVIRPYLVFISSKRRNLVTLAVRRIKYFKGKFAKG